MLRDNSKTLQDRFICDCCSKTQRQTKTNLVVFIRPTVIANSEDGQTITDQRLDGIWEVGGAKGSALTADDLFKGKTSRE